MNEKIQSGKIIVKDIEVNGTENLIKMLSNDTKLVTIFLKVDKHDRDMMKNLSTDLFHLQSPILRHSFFQLFLDYQLRYSNNNLIHANDFLECHERN